MLLAKEVDVTGARARALEDAALTVLKIRKRMIVPKRYCSCARQGTLFIEIGQVIKKRVQNEKINSDFFFS